VQPHARGRAGAARRTPAAAGRGARGGHRLREGRAPRPPGRDLRHPRDRRRPLAALHRRRPRPAAGASARSGGGLQPDERLRLPARSAEPPGPGLLHRRQLGVRRSREDARRALRHDRARRLGDRRGAPTGGTSPRTSTAPPRGSPGTVSGPIRATPRPARSGGSSWSAPSSAAPGTGTATRACSGMRRPRTPASTRTTRTCPGCRSGWRRAGRRTCAGGGTRWAGRCTCSGSLCPAAPRRPSRRPTNEADDRRERLIGGRVLADDRPMRAACCTTGAPGRRGARYGPPGGSQ